MGVEVHPVEDRVEAAVPISLALSLPCAISNYSTSGGCCTHILDALLLPSQGCRVYQDAQQMIDARHAVLIEVVVQVRAVVKRRHHAEQCKVSRLVASGEESTSERSTSSGGGRKSH